MEGVPMRLLRALAAIAALALLLVGVPWLLLLVGNPIDLIGVDWRQALWIGADSRVLLGLLSLVAWAAWLVLALTVVFEAVDVLTGSRISIQLPGTGWLRPAVAALVAAAFAVPGVQPAMAAPPILPDSKPVATSATHAVEAPPSGREYVVEPGDELWAVAESELGDGHRWRELLPLNPGLDEGSRLAPGQVLYIPDEADIHVVEPGDTLWDISADELGDPERWPEVFDLNRDRIDDPDLIDVGWELRLPESVADVRTEPMEAAEPEPVAEPAPAEVPDQAPAPPPPGPAEQSAEAVVEQSPPEQPSALRSAIADGLSAQPVTPQPSAPLAQSDAASGAVEVSPVDHIVPIGAIGAVLAGSVVTGLASRRRAQLLARAVGRRLIPVAPDVARFWTALGQRAEEAPSEVTPTTLVLGWADDEPVFHSLEASRATVVTGSSAESALAAAITGLACSPWNEGVQVLLAGADEWASAFDDPRIEASGPIDAALQRLTKLCSERRLAMRGHTLAGLRADSDVAEAWAPVVVVFAEAVSAAQFDVISDALALGEVGVSVLAVSATGPHIAAAVVDVGPDEATLSGRRFSPQLVDAPARRALLDLFTATGRLDTDPAPWWRAGELPSNVTPLSPPEHSEDAPMKTSPEHPTLLLLGEVELTSAAGTPPNRALGQCMEYCAWLLAHPASRPTAMLRDLLVADTTRRSNMSRLRSWLGHDDDGLPYLPDAYSGRIVLDPRVASDWEQFQSLMSGGVNVASTPALRRALGLVRGEPLGSYGFQWIWAQQMRADMVAMIVDAAVVLADRALTQADAQTALWAVARGRLAAADDDALAVREIQALAMSGRGAEAERAVLALNRSTRAGGRDLPTDLAMRVQAALRQTHAG